MVVATTTIPPKTLLAELPGQSTLTLNQTHLLPWRKLLAALPDNSVDLILTDPAYQLQGALCG